MLIKWKKDNYHYLKNGLNFFSVAGQVVDLSQEELHPFRGVDAYELVEHVEVIKTVSEAPKAEKQLQDLTKKELVEYALEKHGNICIILFYILRGKE